MIAWLRRLYALAECTLGDHVYPQDHVAGRGWVCVRCDRVVRV